MIEPTRLPDRWHTREFPVLLAVARRLDDSNDVVDADDEELQGELGVDQPTLARSFIALSHAQYIEVATTEMMSGDRFATAHELLERGRRAAGLWPDEDAAADALVQLLNQAADQTSDEDDASALRKAGRLLRSVPSAVIADVTAAFIRQQTGI